MIRPPIDDAEAPPLHTVRELGETILAEVRTLRDRVDMGKPGTAYIVGRLERLGHEVIASDPLGEADLS